MTTETLVFDSKQELVEPAATRSAIARAIDEAVQSVGVRRGAHGNIPL